MKVIENNYKNKDISVKNTPSTVVTYCDNCDSKLEITEEDTYIGWLGARFVTCPCCGEESMVDEMDGTTLTVDNIEFPIYFHRVNKNLGAKEVYNEEIVRDIRKAIRYFRTDNSDDTGYYFIEYGEVFMTVYKLDDDDEYYVVVSKDYYHTSISYQDRINIESRFMTNIKNN